MATLLSLGCAESMLIHRYRELSTDLSPGYPPLHAYTSLVFLPGGRRVIHTVTWRDARQIERLPNYPQGYSTVAPITLNQVSWPPVLS